ncbi:tRNA (adenosine(37)-N6)-dimethylallyltransferase MiaA [Siphonobacter sp. SORGH_AS_0500]|uniref:tRNA (adenosine(37)-N6)-dimethylallyltransferase MiaA n=1 Tax=Siphonobacter sp. SORGH_AS_0500 TaxID=1864824 RepID=UPI000CCB3643|nr:tRNA (adenosine(37)-N6)-dimethylallyltransferase MiaA [Siphonobacter sp. SORGH_AS_0500]PKK38268.1 tRNA (adenosine(37)-N6)-dimethylallyltransferase MiaA [Siphonobacter sp. SORGH_AS_0500]
MSELQTLQPLVILGPTASGKTRLAVQLAKEFNAEIISVDSRQVYRDMTIGTGKDLSEYENIPYHLIDLVDAGTAYNLAEFQRDFREKFIEIKDRQKRPVLCGGTGLYLEAVLKNHQYTTIPNDFKLRTELDTLTDEELQSRFSRLHSAFHAVADLSTRKRTIRAIEIAEYLQNNALEARPELTLNPLVMGLNPPVEIRRDRITKRLRERLENGMIEEVEALLNRGIPANRLMYYGLEYKFITEYLEGKWTYALLFERLNVAIHQYAKRQMTFFRKMERDGLTIHWLEGSPDENLMTARTLIKENGE